MAALTLTLGTVAADATSATAGNARLVNVPVGTRTLWVQARAAAARMKVQDESGGVSGADDAAIGSHYITLAANTLYRFRVPQRQGGWTVWVAPDTNAATTIEYYPSPVEQ